MRNSSSMVLVVVMVFVTFCACQTNVLQTEQPLTHNRAVCWLVEKSEGFITGQNNNCLITAETPIYNLFQYSNSRDAKIYEAADTFRLYMSGDGDTNVLGGSIVRVSESQPVDRSWTGARIQLVAQYPHHTAPVSPGSVLSTDTYVPEIPYMDIAGSAFGIRLRFPVSGDPAALGDRCTDILSGEEHKVVNIRAIALDFPNDPDKLTDMWGVTPSLIWKYSSRSRAYNICTKQRTQLVTGDACALGLSQVAVSPYSGRVMVVAVSDCKNNRNAQFERRHYLLHVDRRTGMVRSDDWVVLSKGSLPSDTLIQTTTFATPDRKELWNAVAHLWRWGTRVAPWLAGQDEPLPSAELPATESAPLFVVGTSASTDRIYFYTLDTQSGRPSQVLYSKNATTFTFNRNICDRHRVTRTPKVLMCVRKETS